MSKKLGGQEPIRIDIHDPNDLKGTLQHVGGSRSDAWNNIIINQAVRALWIKHSDEEALGDQRKATVLGLAGIGPKDELEGMLAAQLLAAHNASMECYRRGMLGEQTFEGRRENLAQANKLSRTYSMLVDSLNRHRGKGQQKVTVEHVHVNAGGQAVVGTVEHRGGGVQSKSEDQPDAKQLTNASQLPMWSEDKERESVPVARDAERPLPDARRNVTGRTEGK
jgi:hypothetical protein